MTAGLRTPRRRATRAAVAVALTVGAGAAGDAASAQSLDPATVTVSDFASVALGGNATTTTATMSNFTVTDSAGVGWHVTVQATLFAEVDGAGAYVAGGKTLPAGSLAMPAPTVTPAGGSVTVAAGPYLLDGATVQIVTAGSGTTGTFTVTQGGPLTLSLPASVFARTYRSDVTVAVQSGP